MKTKIFIQLFIEFLLFGLLIQYADAQNVCQFDTSYFEGTGRTIETLNSGNIIVGGYHFTGINDATGILMCLDSKGRINWKKQIKNGALNLINDICVDKNDNIYAIGECDNNMIFIAKFNKKGNEVWYKKTEIKNSYYSGLKINIDTKGNLAYINGRNILVFVSAYGDIIRKVTTYPNMTVNSFKFDAHDNVIGVGYVEDNLSLIKLNNEGKLIAYYNNPTSTTDWGRDIDITSDDCYVIIANTCVDAKNNTHYKYIAKFDNKLNLIWNAKVFSRNYCNGLDKIRIFQDNELVVSSYTHVPGNYIDAELFSLDGNGKLLSERTFGEHSSDMAFDIAILHNNVIFAGEKSQDKFWVVSINKETLK